MKCNKLSILLIYTKCPWKIYILAVTALSTEQLGLLGGRHKQAGNLVLNTGSSGVVLPSRLNREGRTTPPQYSVSDTAGIAPPVPLKHISQPTFTQVSSAIPLKIPPEQS